MNVMNVFNRILKIVYPALVFSAILVTWASYNQAEVNSPPLKPKPEVGGFLTRSTACDRSNPDPINFIKNSCSVNR